MKNTIITILILFFAGYLLKAAPDTLYYKANQLYQEGRYEESIELYESVLVAGFESASLYYNLGNACFRSNKLGKARLYYEKSLKLNPEDEDTQTNLIYLEGLLADRFEVVPEIFFKKWIKSAISSLSADKWAYLSIFSFVISIFALIVYLLLRQIMWRKSGFIISIIALLLSLSSLGAAWKQNRLIVNSDSAVVIDLSVNVNSTPSETGTGLFILHEGAKVWLEDNTTGWQEIRLSDGRKGWVPEGSIQTI